MIKIKGILYPPDHLGLEIIEVEGIRYQDITPLIVDCGRASEEIKHHIESYMSSRAEG